MRKIRKLLLQTVINLINGIKFLLHKFIKTRQVNKITVSYNSKASKVGSFDTDIS